MTLLKTVLFISILPATALAQFNQKLKHDFSEIYAIPDIRYDNISDANKNYSDRIQGRIRMGFTYQAGKFELIGLASTGDSFGNDWFNVYDLKTGQQQKGTLSFRQLYLQRAFGKDIVQLGSFGGFRTVGAGGIGSTSGYVEGIKYQHPTKFGNVSVILGGINPSNPDLFTREFTPNYVQIEFNKHFASKVLLDSRYDHFQNNDYINEQIEFSPEVFGQKILKLMAEELYEIQNGASTYELGASFDLLAAFNDTLKNRFVVDGYWSHLDPAMHDRNALNSAYYQDGNMLALRASGAIDKKGNFTWYARDSKGQKSRIDIGFGYNLHRKRQ